jgi:hypothetical protein
MRSRRSRLLRILIVTSAILAMGFIQHYVFHRPFVYQLFFMVSVFGPLMLLRYLDVAAQRRRARAQQASTEEERDASGG